VAITGFERISLTLFPKLWVSTLSIYPLVNEETTLIMSMLHSVPVNVTM